MPIFTVGSDRPSTSTRINDSDLGEEVTLARGAVSGRGRIRGKPISLRRRIPGRSHQIRSIGRLGFNGSPILTAIAGKSTL